MNAADRTGRQRFPRGRDERPGARLVLLGLGSNHDCAANVPKAIDELSYEFDLLVKSARYVGPPEGDEGRQRDEAPAFWNVSVLVRTADPYPEIRAKLRDLEARLGRDRSTPEVVTIDIDVLLIQDEVIRDGEGTIVVPHPDLTTKRHAAIPSAEVAPGLVHPRTNQRVAEIAAALA